MTREEANKYIKSALRRTWNEKKCEEIIKALEQEPNCPFYEIDDDGHGLCKNHRYMDECGDAVSRESIKRAYKQRMVDSLKDDKRGIDLSKYTEEPYERFCEFIDSI